MLAKGEIEKGRQSEQERERYISKAGACNGCNEKVKQSTRLYLCVCVCVCVCVRAREEIVCVFVYVLRGRGSERRKY